MAKANLDALIPREDFEVIRNQEPAPKKGAIQLRELERGEFFSSALRKPDFQRDTDDWSPQRVVDLIGTFLNDDLIPAVVLWRNRDLYFVIDGAHRLGSLMAWVQNDYGDGEVSQRFFNYSIPGEQKRIAKRAREMAENAFGTYLQHKEALVHPENFSEKIRTRAKQLGASLSLELQWVRGESSAQADQSFKRINQRSAIITPQEFHLLETRKQPITISARAILWKGKGRKYWDDKQDEIEQLADQTHDLLFTPPIPPQIKSADLPVAGSTYASSTLVMLHQYVEICAKHGSKCNLSVDDADGAATLECLRRANRVAKLICSADPSSLGLHPGVYFYSWTGKHQPILFLTIASLIVEYERNGVLPKFLQRRKVLEKFLINNRALINQVVRKFGSKNPEDGKLRGFYSGTLDAIGWTSPRLVGALADSIMAVQGAYDVAKEVYA